MTKKSSGWVQIGGMIALALSAAQVAHAEPVALGDIFRIHKVLDPRISSDGSMVAFLEERADVATDQRITTLHLVKADGRDDHIEGSTQASVSQPCWSADGRLAYVTQDPAGSAIVVFTPGTTKRITIALPALRPQNLAWSPDGTSLAFLAGRPDGSAPAQVTPPPKSSWAKPPFVTETAGFQTVGDPLVPPTRLDLYVVAAAAEAKPQQVLKEPVAFGLGVLRFDLEWNADGKSILLAANRSREFWRHAIMSDVFQADLSTGRIIQFSVPHSSSYNPVSAPDGQQVAFLCWENLAENFIRHDICIYNLKTAVLTHVPNTADQRLSALHWLADSKHLVAAIEAQGRIQIARFDLAGNYSVLAETQGGDLSAYTERVSLSVARNDTIAFVKSSASLPGDVAVISAGGKEKLITAVNARYLAGRELPTVRELHYPAPGNAMTSQAWLWLPPHYDPAKTYPLFVLIHGGRSLVFGPDFDIAAEVFAARGYLVVMPNYRSSGGFGSGYANSLPNYPTGLDNDVLAAVDAAKHAASVDPERMFIGGGSGGGATTGWTIAHHSDFRAAAMWFAPVDWASYSLESAAGFSGEYALFGEDPMAARMKLAARSPITFAGTVKTPTLLVVGDHDRITPMSQSIQFFNALQYLSVPSQLQIVPGEPHGDEVRPSHQLMLLLATLNWFERFGSGISPAPLEVPEP